MHTKAASPVKPMPVRPLRTHAEAVVILLIFSDHSGRSPPRALVVAGQRTLQFLRQYFESFPGAARHLHISV